MAKGLPYFRWFTADAKADEKYTAMPDLELGFFHRCLNHAWDNDGLPADLDEVAAVMHASREYVDQVWARVGRCWSIGEGGRLRNSRQEKERKYATTKSVRNASAAHSRYERSANAERTQCVRTDYAAQRAYDSDSVSVSSKVLKSSTRFHEFWERYPRKFGQDSACRDWVSEVTTENEAEVFACLGRYLASDEVQRSAVMSAGSTTRDTGWIVKCARDGWKSEWPTAKAPKGMSLVGGERTCPCGQPVGTNGKLCFDCYVNAENDRFTREAK